MPRFDLPVRKRRAIWLGLSALVAIAVGMKLFWPETQLSVGLSISDAVTRRDAGTLLHYISDEEKAASGLDEKKLQAFLDTIVAPRLSVFRLLGRENWSYHAASNTTTVSRQVRRGDGLTLTMNFNVMSTPDGPRCFDLLSAMLYSALLASSPEGRPMPRDRENSKLRADEIDRDLTKLQATGIQRILIDVKGNPTVLTWEELRDYYRR